MAIPLPPEQQIGGALSFEELNAGLEQATATIAALTAGIAAIKAGTYTGRDRGGLVTAAVDGQRQITKVTFSSTVGRYEPKVVEEAVVAAVRAAMGRITEAYVAFTADHGIEVEPEESDDAPAPGPIPGLVFDLPEPTDSADPFGLPAEERA